MTARKPRAAETTWTLPAEQVAAPRQAKAQSYVAGSHTARVRSEHDERRTELLARDEILSGEIERRQAEREDIGEALRLMSDPGEVANVVPLRQAGE